MLPDREGLFHAYPAEIGIDETGANKLATVIMRFRLFEELADGKWLDCLSEGLEITGYFYLECRDGSVNSMTIDALTAALGWDGREPFWLQETDLSEKPVQVKLAFENYDGKKRLKVQYLNPYGSSGRGVTKADGATKTSIRNRLGPKLRSLAGPAKTPAKDAADAPKPEAPSAPPKASPSAEPPDTSPAECTMQEAWDEFVRHCKDEWSQAEIEREWFSVLIGLFGGKQPDELSPAEWAVMRDKGPGKIIPF